ncbi:MAG: YlxR family protein [Clostridia bacterium]
MHIKQIRKCVACRECKNQLEMLRVTKIGDEIMMDLRHKLGGRGAYVCNNADCISLTIKKRLLNRAFKSNLDNSIYDQLGDYEQNN